MKKVFLILSVLCAIFMAASCKMDAVKDPSKKTEQDSGKNNTQDNSGGQDNTQNQSSQEPEDTREVYVEEAYKNPTHGKTRAASLDFIFNNQTLGTTTITIKRSEWNNLCNDYRYFYKNENCVHVESYKYEKDGETWLLKNVGFRLRGNTSRVVPQGQDNGREQEQMNVGWASDYYDYAEQPNNDYRQTHFKVDFEEFAEDDVKMSGCMKSVALKRMDNTCTKEIFCYNLFRQNGIWTAPRASHTRLLLRIIEDEEGGNNYITNVDFGVYEMFEEVNKQSLKARESGKNNSADNAWGNNSGNLWKCQNDLTTKPKAEGKSFEDEMGVEDMRIVHAGEEVPESENYVEKDDTYGGNRIGYIKDSYTLDLKTNKTNLDSAKTELMGFISELNALPNPTDKNDTESINTIKAFYEKWFDMDFFLKTYAINIICGMDDDYWGNANNYYLYFDTAAGGTGKVYFIPFDYDNTLGGSIKSGGILHDPMDWGRGANRPLIDKLLLVPEYKDLFKNYILECLNNEYWKYENCSKLFRDWGTMVEPYLDSPDLVFKYGGAKELNYDVWSPQASLVEKDNNLYDLTRYSFTRWLNGEHLYITQDTTFTGGIKINIGNIPENAAMRHIYIDDKLVAIIDRDWDENSLPGNISHDIFDTDWQYPYVQNGKEYEIFVSYLNTDYGTIEESERIRVTANGGIGELSVNDNFDYSIENNKLIFDPVPVISLNGTTVDTGKYHIEFKKAEDWDWINGFDIGTTISEIDLTKPDLFPRDKGVTTSTQLMIKLYYDIPYQEDYGDVYRYEIVVEDESREKNLHISKNFDPQIKKINDNYTGLHLQFDEELPDGLYSYEVYLNGKKVSEMERNYDNGEHPAAHIADKDWYYPYVQAGNEYKVEVKYRYKNWWDYNLAPETIIATSGLGEISLQNPVTYSITNNHLKFSGPIVVKIGNTEKEEPNCYFNIDQHNSTRDGWISGCGLESSELADLDLDLNMVISDEYRPISTADTLSFELVYNDESVVATKGYNYRYYIFSHDDTRKQNLHLTNALNSRYTVDYGTSSKPGITITLNEDVIPTNAYSREVYLNGKNISEMERDSEQDATTGNWHDVPSTHINDTTWYYPYVEAGKDYSFDIIYRTENWHEAARFGPIKVKATTGLGELSVSNKNNISFEIDANNHLKFTTPPVLKLGNDTLENPYYKFNIDSYARPDDDRWIAWYGGSGNTIDIDLNEQIDDYHRPVLTSALLSFEMYYQEYDEDRGYDYRYNIFYHDETVNENLHLASSLNKEEQQQGGQD